MAMMVDTSITLGLLMLLFGVSLACDQSALGQCFSDLYSPSQGSLTDSQLSDYLLGMINPSSVNHNQEELCSATEDYDFSVLHTCVDNAGCADETIPISSQMNGMPALSITWSDIVDLTKGACEPGCEDMGTKNEEAQKCTPKAYSVTGCEDLADLFTCYRNAIGSCEVLITFTESLIKQYGVMDSVNDMCPGYSFSLRSKSSTIIPIREGSAINPTYKIISSVMSTKSPTCKKSAVNRCFGDIAQSMGISNSQISSNLMGMVDPSSLSHNQAATCEALKNFDFSELKSCISNVGCADESIMSGYEYDPEIPTITYSDIVDLIKGMCQPGCEDLEGKNEKAKECGQHVSDTDCKSMEKAFSCYRDIMSGCEVLITFTEHILKQSSEVQALKDKCPGYNFSLRSKSSRTVSSYWPITLAILSVFMVMLQY